MFVRCCDVQRGLHTPVKLARQVLWVCGEPRAEKRRKGEWSQWERASKNRDLGLQWWQDCTYAADVTPQLLDPLRAMSLSSQYVDRESGL